MAFRRLGDAIRGSSSSKKFNAQEVIITLKLASRRLVKQRKKLESKERENIKKLQTMAADGDRQKAKQYAQRIAEMRAMVRQIENSEMTIFGLWTSAIATDTRRFCPPERLPTGLSI